MVRLMPAPSIPWPHAPTHQLAHQGTYFITARTYEAAHHFRGVRRLTVLHRGLLRLAHDLGWQLEAWAVFSNHYHFVAHSPAREPDASSLRAMLSLLHEKTAKWVNRLDRAPGRKVWFNYRETRLTYQKSYLSRLNYTHQNAVKHGLVVAAHLYPWCSASWFERMASPAQVKAIYRFRTDRLKLDDEFEVAPEW
jgi:putative transposase